MRVTVCAETNYQALKLWFFPRKGVRTHGEPNLEGFSFSVAVPSTIVREPAWAAEDKTLAEVSPICVPRSLLARDYTREESHG